MLSLPSDSSMDLYPDNTISHYRIKLDRPIELEDGFDYEVGMTGFIYPKTWYNIGRYELCALSTSHRLPEGEDIAPASLVDDMASLSLGAPTPVRTNAEYVVDRGDVNGHGYPPSGSDTPPTAYEEPPQNPDALAQSRPPQYGEYDQRKAFKFQLQPGRYRDTDHVIQELNRKRAWSGITFYYKQVTDQVTIEISARQAGKIRLRMTPDLSLKLGFGPDEFMWAGPYGARITSLGVSRMEPINMIHVHCDIIQSAHYVGHQMAPLLKSVGISGKHGDIVTFEPQWIDFFPLRLRRFDTIQVLLSSDTGRPVPFERGRSLVKLHIRRARPFG